MRQVINTPEALILVIWLVIALLATIGLIFPNVQTFSQNGPQLHGT